MLNRALYLVLRQVFGGVRVKCENEVGDYEQQEKQVQTSAGMVSRTYLSRVRGGRYGESYAMNCPFCGDSRGRFSVSHMFGRVDSATGRRRLSGLFCFNEAACHEDLENASDLWNRIELAMELDGSGDLELPDGVTTLSTPIACGEVGQPGKCIPLAELLGDWSHPAIRYLIGRGLDVGKLSCDYGVQYIVRGHQWQALDGRLYIPFYRRGILIGWTARSVPGVSDSERKYLNSSGSMGGILYGLRGAMDCRVAVLVEGVIDKWSVGKPAFAVLTKTLGWEKRTRLTEAILRSRISLLVVLLDPEQSPKDKIAGRPHHVPEAVAAVESLNLVDVLPVWLPQWLDPGACRGEYLADYLRMYLEEAGYGELGSVLAGDVLGSSATVR